MILKIKSPKVFISYSWEDDKHQAWVYKLAAQLQQNGIKTILDQWDLHYGDQLPEFMESIVKNDYVLVVCTPNYKKKFDKRIGGVGFEGDIMTSELLSKRNRRKFIPILRKGDASSAFPISLSSTKYIDMRVSGNFRKAYTDLIAYLLGRKKSPVLRPIKPFLSIEGGKSWVLVMSTGTGFTHQNILEKDKFPLDEVNKKYDDGFNITSLSYGDSKWLIVLSKGINQLEQTYSVSKSFPYSTVRNKSKKGFQITSVSYGSGTWVVVFSKGGRHIKQSWCLRQSLPKRRIKEGWNKGYQITFLNYSDGRWVFINSKGYGYNDSAYQPSKRLPIEFIKEKGEQDCHVTQMSYANSQWIVTVATGTNYTNQIIEVLSKVSRDKLKIFYNDGYYITSVNYGFV